MDFLNRHTIKKVMGLILFTVLLYVGLQNTKLVGSVLQYVIRLLAPLLIGGVIAVILNVPMRFIETHLFGGDYVKKHKWLCKMKRMISLLLTLVIVIGVVVIVLFMVAPQLYKSIVKIGEQLPIVRDSVPGWFDRLTDLLPMFAESLQSLKSQWLNINWTQVGESVVKFFFSGGFLSNTFNVASSILSGLTNAFIGLVFAIYILTQKETLGRQFRRLFYSFLPERKVDYFLRVANLTTVSFNNFLSGQCLEAIILGVMFFFAMLALSLPYPLVISVLIGVTALIPIFGAFIGCIIGVLLILIANQFQALLFLLLFLVLQQIEGNVIYPRVVGGSVGLPSIWVLAAVTLGASLAGILGMLFAIPLFSVLYTLMREAVRGRIENRDIDEKKTS